MFQFLLKLCLILNKGYLIFTLFFLWFWHSSSRVMFQHKIDFLLLLYHVICHSWRVMDPLKGQKQRRQPSASSSLSPILYILKFNITHIVFLIWSLSSPRKKRRRRSVSKRWMPEFWLEFFIDDDFHFNAGHPLWWWLRRDVSTNQCKYEPSAQWCAKYLQKYGNEIWFKEKYISA